MSDSASVSKAKKRRLRLAALGLIVLGLWGMLALLLGASVGKETRYRADLKTDLQPGFGETHATPHPLHERVEAAIHERPLPKDLPPLCVGQDCFGTAQGRDTAYLDKPPGDDVDDATSSIGRPRGPQSSSGTPPFNIAQGGAPNFFPGGLFIPGGGGNPNPGNPENPTGGSPHSPDDLNPPDNPDTPQKPGNTPPLDFIQPPLSNTPVELPIGGPEGPGGPGGPEGPHGPTGPEGPTGPGGPPNGGPDKPIQIPEPLTLSLFAAGVAGSVLLRRRKSRSSK